MEITFQNQLISILPKYSRFEGKNESPELSFYTEFKVNNSVFIGVTNVSYSQKKDAKYNLAFSFDNVQFMETEDCKVCDKNDWNLMNRFISLFNTQKTFGIEKEEYEQFITNNQRIFGNDLDEKESLTIRQGQKVYTSDFSVAWQHISSLIKKGFK